MSDRAPERRTALLEIADCNEAGHMYTSAKVWDADSSKWWWVVTIGPVRARERSHGRAHAVAMLRARRELGL